jgi:N-acyl homoserine lactone hydrolase
VNADKPVIRPHLVADVQAFGGTFPVYAHTIEHADGLVLVDTGMTGSHPLVRRSGIRAATRSGSRVTWSA